MLVERFNYRPLERHTPVGGQRYYVCPETNAHLPSVTRIIDNTSDQTGLLEWRNRIGNDKANEIVREALNLGTLMHTHLECFVEGRPRPTGNNLIRVQAEYMADKIIENGLSLVEEVWGSEVGIYSPGLYAGTIDGLGVCRLPSGEVVQAIFDYKTARKMKKKEQIGHYFEQMCAYAVAHNDLYDSKIDTGIIFMVDRDLNWKNFIITGDEFKHYTELWFGRVEKYYGQLNQ